MCESRYLLLLGLLPIVHGLQNNLIWNERSKGQENPIYLPKRYDAPAMKEIIAEEGRRMALGHVTSRPGSRPCPCEKKSLCDPITKQFNLETFIFSTNESNWIHYEWSRITSVATFKYYNDDFMCAAHKENARVIIAVDFPKSMLQNSTARQTWVSTIVANVTYNFIDGVNVDFEEGMSETDPDRPYLNLLIIELNKALKAVSPYYQLSFDFPCTPDGYRHYDYKTLMEYLDIGFIMAYDMLQDSSHATANSPLPVIAQGIEKFNASGIDLRKLVLGLPWYGYWFFCTDYGGQSHKCTSGARGQIAYDDILTNFNKYGMTDLLWDKKSASPFFTVRDPVTQRPIQIWYDDPPSLKLKFGLIKKFNLKGSGNWEADELDYKNAAQVEGMWGAFPDGKF